MGELTLEPVSAIYCGPLPELKGQHALVKSTYDGRRLQALFSQVNGARTAKEIKASGKRPTGFERFMFEWTQFQRDDFIIDLD